MDSKIIFLDLDGVFADFKKRFREIVHFDYDTDPEGAWRRLDQVDNLFLTLDPFPYAKEMFDEIQSYGIETKVLTALPWLTGKLKTAAADKEAWVRQHLSPTIEVICTEGWKGKRQYAPQHNILIDDMRRNIDDWRDAGGVGIHHKAPGITIRSLWPLVAYKNQKN